MGKRILHRHGVIFEGRLLPPAGRPGPGASEAERRAVVRFSNTFGWPAPLPDWMGMAIKLAEPGGGETDLLLVSARPGELAWRRPGPSRAALAPVYTSWVPYHFGARARRVVAIPEAPRGVPLAELHDPGAICPLAYELSTWESPDVRDPLGRLELADGRPDDEGLRFRPPVDPSGLSTLRSRVYRWCRGR